MANSNHAFRHFFPIHGWRLLHICDESYYNFHSSVQFIQCIPLWSCVWCSKVSLCSFMQCEYRLNNFPWCIEATDLTREFSADAFVISWSIFMQIARRLLVCLWRLHKSKWFYRPRIPKEILFPIPCNFLEFSWSFNFFFLLVFLRFCLSRLFRIFAFSKYARFV